MANGNSGSGALTTKIHAMYGGRLTQENYKELLRKQTVTEAASYIKQLRGYADVLRDVNESTIHRGQLELLLRRELFEEYKKIFHYVGRGELPFYKYLVTQMEIDEILSCVRSLNAGRQGDYIFSLPAFLTKHSSFDLYSLAKVRTMEDLKALLKDTHYGEIIGKLEAKEGSQIDIVSLETELRRYYYSKLFKQIDRAFSGKVGEQVGDSFGMYIDLHNITVIFRMKKYFNMESAKIRPILLPYHFRLKQDDLDAMLNAPDADTAWALASKTYYGRFIAKKSYEVIEKYAQETMYHYHKFLFINSTSTPVVVVAYFNLKSIEIDNLIGIIEGIRYGLEPSEIAKLLVGTDS